MSLNNKRILISCGGTGGHIYPALVIAEEIREKYPGSKILFVGAKGKMEMNLIPSHGFEITGLPIRGLIRGALLKNFFLIFKLISSLLKTNRIINNFKPDVVFGTGGYASAPTLFCAAIKKIPTIIHEQNNVMGLTNRILAKYVDKVCVSYKHLLNFLPHKKVKLTGTPIRTSINSITKENARAYFNLSLQKKTLLVFGGSQGTNSINTCILNNLDLLIKREIQLIWITGQKYFQNIKDKITDTQRKSVYILPFLEKMEYAYAATDIVIARGGAVTVAEVCPAKLPAVFIASPNVTDHQQKKNIEPLLEADACISVNDSVINEHLIKQTIWLFENKLKREAIVKNISSMKMTDSVEKIIKEIEKIIK